MQTKVDCSHCGARQDAPFALQRYSDSKSNLERAFRSQFTNCTNSSISSVKPEIHYNGNNVSDSSTPMKISVTPATPPRASSTPATPNHNSVKPATLMNSSPELLSALTGHLDVMESVLTKPWKPFSDCIQKLSAMLAAKGNTLESSISDEHPE